MQGLVACMRCLTVRKIHSQIQMDEHTADFLDGRFKRAEAPVVATHTHTLRSDIQLDRDGAVLAVYVRICSPGSFVCSMHQRKVPTTNAMKPC